MTFRLWSPIEEYKGNISLSQVKEVFSNLKKMDEEHGVLWISDENENVIELQKDLKIFFILEEGEYQESINLCDFAEFEKVIQFFLSNQISKIKDTVHEKKEKL